MPLDSIKTKFGAAAVVVVGVAMTPVAAQTPPASVATDVLAVDENGFKIVNIPSGLRDYGYNRIYKTDHKVTTGPEIIMNGVPARDAIHCMEKIGALPQGMLTKGDFPVIGGSRQKIEITINRELRAGFRQGKAVKEMSLWGKLVNGTLAYGIADAYSRPAGGKFPGRITDVGFLSADYGTAYSQLKAEQAAACVEGIVNGTYRPASIDPPPKQESPAVKPTRTVARPEVPSMEVARPTIPVRNVARPAIPAMNVARPALPRFLPVVAPTR